MFYRNGEYVYLDGTLFSLENLQSIYMSRTKQGIVLLYLNGHKIEIKYDTASTCEKCWKELRTEINDIVDNKKYIELHESMIVRVAAIQHIEFDEIDSRFAVLYKTGECFVYDFDSETITLGMYRNLLERYFKVKLGNRKTFSVESRHRADFWSDVTAEISGRASNEPVPNKDFWLEIDKALVSVKKEK